MAVRPRLYNIPAGRDFLADLAQGLLAAHGESPLRLSRVLVLLPTRRACRALRDAFLRATDGAALLLPRLKPIGDVDEDDLDLEEAAESGDDAALDLPPAVAPLRRQMLLARLVLAADAKRTRLLGDRGPQAMTPAQAVTLAGDLARLLDDVQVEGLDFAALRTLAPERFAQHWQEILDFLAIVTDFWPAILADEGAIDPAERRNRLIRARAARWLAAPPDHPVIAAGSTGSVPATADLLAAVAALPEGAVVLPGLDGALDDPAWAALAPIHPQYMLKRLLDRLEVQRGDVALWPASDAAVARGPAELRDAAPGDTPGGARVAALRAALRPADVSVPDEDVPAAAFADLVWLDHGSAQDEAVAIALLLRETLERPGRTAALVTPDRTLARRVAAELGRWRVEADDSAGTPLGLTPPGVFLRLVAQAVASAPAPVPLLALLKHPLAALGRPRIAFLDNARRLERLVLRGPRPAAGFDGLRAALAAVAAARPGRVPPGLPEWLDELAAAVADFAAALAGSALPPDELLQRHVALAEALAMTDRDDGRARLWVEDAGEAAALFIGELREAVAGLPPLAGSAYPAFFEAAMDGRVVRPRQPRHPRVTILGPLEARLLRADTTVLAGLNEGTWPPVPPPDPWMSRPMRAAFGLSPAERRIGQSAHDFATLAAAGRVHLSRATKVDGVPTVPARWLLRLAGVAQASGVAWKATAEAPVQHWARALDEARFEPRPPPAPRPPLAARPRELSVTRIETWIRDPYAIYARSVLGLRKLDPLDADPGAAGRGTVIHEALDRFVALTMADDGALSLDALLAIGRAVFAEQRIAPAVAAFWWPRFERIARWFVEHERSYRGDWRPLASEVTGRIERPGPAGPFALTCKADRIDRGRDGTLAIVDYKTGVVPSDKQIKAGLAPQLPLEALIAEAGGFAGVVAAPAGRLAFWRLTGGLPAGEELPVKGGVAALARRYAAILDGLVAAFDDPATPYLAIPREAPDFVPKFNDYAHLERIAEWSAHLLDQA